MNECGRNGVIGKWTTPSIMYKPSKVEITDVAEIYVTVSQVGNGSSATARSNAFEVTSDGGIVLKSPNGTRYKISVSDSGAINATAI